ncbi:MAG: hypothetical protein HQ515_20645, partial [Phycisphaeraceae bacterium]|nr:hypothetical protein [Phycisphaeraceae bacterium]
LSEAQGLEVLARYIDVNGLACGPETSMTNTHTGDQEKSSLAMTSEGQFVLAWESSAPGSGSTDIHYCWGHCPSLSDLNADSRTDFQDFSILAQGWRQASPDDAGFAPASLAELGLVCSQWLTRSIAPMSN